jgi:hypothetical protein
VRLPCSTASLPCLFNRSTVERAFAVSSRCPLCTHAYALAGPQPGGTMRTYRDASSCAGHEVSKYVLVSK